MVEALSQKVISELVGSIYDCALDPDRWEQTLIGIRDALDGHTAVFGMVDIQRDHLLINRTIGLDSYGVDQLAKHEPEINSILLDFIASTSDLDKPLIVSRHLSAKYVETSPYLQEMLKHKIIDVIHYFLLNTPTHIAGIGFGRHERQGIITEREIELGGLLLPHLRRSVTISKVLELCTIERARLAETLDTLRCGVVLTNERSAILHANQRADQMLRRGGSLQDIRGVLQAKVPSAAAELRTAIGLAARDEAKIGRAGLAIRLTEPDEPPVFAHVLPLTGGDVRTRLQSQAAAAVFIATAPDEQEWAQLVAVAYGLTPAETRVLASLLARRTLAETAVALNIAPTTARTHLDNIFLKTGIRRQSELIALAMQVAPPVGLPVLREPAETGSSR